jgi:hypothetical protein
MDPYSERETVNPKETGQESKTLTKVAKTPEEVAHFNETKNTSDFLKRMKQVKMDPTIIGYSDLISGLFEKDHWMFICKQHISSRFSNDEELKEHFRKAAHKQSKFGLSLSTYE